MHFSFRNRVHLLEGLRPKPGAKETMKKTESQFNEEVMEPTSEVVEPPARFEYTRAYRQMECEQPMFQFLPTEEMSHEYETWPAGTWVPIPQRDSKYNEDIAESTSEVVEPPPQFDYSRDYGQVDYQQPMFEFLPTEEMSYEYETWPAGTWVPIAQRDSQFNEVYTGSTYEVVEPPPQFDYSRGYGQVDYEQPMFQFLPMEEMSYEYETWPAGTWVPIAQRDSQFNEDYTGSTYEVVEPPPQFDYSRVYGQVDYEQPMFQSLPTEEMSYEYDTWPVGTWVPTLHRDNPFCGDSVGQMPPGYLQYPPQLEWMNTYQW